MSWQIKNDTVAGYLVLWVLQMALSIGNLTEVLSHLQHLQKQCKYLPLVGCAAFLHNVIIVSLEL